MLNHFKGVIYFYNCSQLHTVPSCALRALSLTIAVIRISCSLLLFVCFVTLPTSSSISCRLHTAPSGSLIDYSLIYSECRLDPCFGRGPAHRMRQILRHVCGEPESLLLINLGQHLEHQASLLLPGRIRMV